MNAPDARDWRAALKAFTDGLRALYGLRLHRVILYGSRARGDDVADSDVDTLVVLGDLEDSWQESKRIGPLATRILVEHGVLITAVTATLREAEESTASLFANIRREGVRVA
ncbi:MAG: nucleotidyltransferase domain-containing protein [Candidatus Rokuibacteriota bacterium]